MRTLLLVAVAAASTACATLQPPAQSVAGLVAGDTIVPPPSPAITPSIPSLPALDRQLLDRMSDANILEHLAGRDSLEIAMAQVAQRRTRNPAVARFAGHLIANHTASLFDEKRVATRDNVPLQIAPGDTTVPHLFVVLDSLRMAPDSGFDRLYMTTQVDLHQRMLAELQTLRTVARDELLKRHIDREIPIVRAHLTHALEIVGTM